MSSLSKKKTFNGFDKKKNSIDNENKNGKIYK